MTSEEFKTFKRSIALSTVKLDNGEIDAEAHITDMYAILGEETFNETEKLLKKRREKKQAT